MQINQEAIHHTIGIQTTIDLAKVKAWHDAVFGAAGVMNGQQLFYTLDFDQLYFTTTIIFGKEKVNSTPFHPRHGNEPIDLICSSFHGATALLNQLEESLRSVELESEEKLKSNGSLTFSKSVAWKPTFIHPEPSCGRALKSNCQTCDSACFQSFGDDYSGYPLELLTEKLKAFYLD